MELPASVQELADVIGRERALYLIGQLPRCIAGKPGKQSSRVILYIPKRLGPDHPLVRILGIADAFKLVEAFGGEIMQPANCAEVYRRFRDQSIARLAREGQSAQSIADQVGVTKRHVQAVLRAFPQEERRAQNDNDPVSRKSASIGRI